MRLRRSATVAVTPPSPPSGASGADAFTDVNAAPGRTERHSNYADGARGADGEQPDGLIERVMFQPRGPKAALLDIGGTLLDSNDAQAGAWLDTFHEAGYSQLRFEYVRSMIGMGTDRILWHCAGISGESSLGRALASRQSATFCTRYLPALRPFVGARTLLRLMRAQGMTLVAISTASDEEFVRTAHAAGVQDLFDSAVTAADALRSIPEPDLVAAAVGLAGVPRNAVVTLADTPYDVQACRRARVPVVALRCGGWLDHSLMGAVAVFDDIADLLVHYESSPFALSDPAPRRLSFSLGTGAASARRAPGSGSPLAARGASD